MNLSTTHIQTMLGESLDTIKGVQKAADTSNGDWSQLGTIDRNLMGTINKLRHAAEELEAERLESIYGIKQV